MPESASRSLLPLPRWMLLLSIALPLLALVLLGQDRNWDLLNYHLYNPHAWLHGRLLLDIAPAQVQSWHNPLLDVPLYLMVRAGLPGLLVGLWLTLPMMLAMYLLLRLYLLLAIHPVTRTSLAMVALMAITGAAAFAELGTCFNDGFVAAGVIGSLYVLIREDRAADRSSAWLLAGTLAGATTGLKLTAAVYCLGLGGAAIAMPSWRQLPRRTVALLLGGIAGFILTYGYWGVLLLHLHGNPFFPYYNQIFHSADAASVSNADVRFQPDSLRDVVMVPLRLLHITRRYSEIKLRDPRLLLGIVAYLALLWRTHRGGANPNNARLARVRMLGAFFFVSYTAWAWQSGVYRYVLPLELLACLGLGLLLEWLPLRWARTGVIVVGLLVVVVTHRPNWGRSHFGLAFVQVQMPTLPHGSMIVLSSQSPLAYAVTALPDDVAAISVNNNFMHPGNCTALSIAAERRITAHAGPLWLLRANDPADDDRQLSAENAYGLVVAAPCEQIATNLGDLRLCPLRREPRLALCATPASTPGR